MMTLVCGGAASGKSAYAEALVCGIQSPSEDRNLSGLLDSAHRFYIATMQPFGKEAEERIRKHRAMRADKGFETMACEALRDIPVRMISYGGSNHNISFLIHKDDKKATLQALSKVLF